MTCITVGCGWLHVQVEARVTVLTVGGEVDKSNSDRLYAHGCRMFTFGGPLIVDMAPLSFLGVSGYRILLDIAHRCDRQHRPWVLLSCEALTPYLRVDRHAHHLPVVASLDEAIACFQALPVQPHARSDFRLPGIHGLADYDGFSVN